MGVGIYYFYHGFGLKAFEGRHIRIEFKIYSHTYLNRASLEPSFVFGIDRCSVYTG